MTESKLNSDFTLSDEDLALLEKKLKKSSKLRKRQKMHRPKTTVGIHMDAQHLLDMLKLLFEHGLTFHQFFNFITQQAIERDPRVMELVIEAQGHKRQRMLEGRENTIEPETLYAMIQERLEEMGHNDEET